MTLRIDTATYAFRRNHDDTYTCIKSRYDDVALRGETYSKGYVEAIAAGRSDVLIDDGKPLAPPLQAEIIPFPCVANEIAAVLESLAARARAGEITGVVLGAIVRDGTTETDVMGVDYHELCTLIQHLDDMRMLTVINENIDYFE
jgi:hypothetical protein